jgi:hypothetical protein
MRISFAALAATLAVSAVVFVPVAAEAQSRRGEPIVRVKPRSFLDAGTTVQVGTFQNYSTGMLPLRASDVTSGWGGPENRILPDRFGGARPFTFGRTSSTR